MLKNTASKARFLLIVYRVLTTANTPYEVCYSQKFVIEILPRYFQLDKSGRIGYVTLRE